MKRKSAYFLLVSLTLVTAGGSSWWLRERSENAVAEHAAISVLTELGAIVVMDGRRQHVASLNLSTLTTPEKLQRALEQLSALPCLSSLDASRTSIGDDQLRCAGNCGSLQSLTLVGTNVSDVGLKHLTGLDQLQSLNLAGTKITSRGLRNLATLEKLKVLDVSDTSVTENLKLLSRLPNVEWLVLRRLSLADGAVAELAECPKLRRLSLDGSTYSPDTLQALEKRRPDLSISE